MAFSIDIVAAVLPHMHECIHAGNNWFIKIPPFKKKNKIYTPISGLIF